MSDEKDGCCPDCEESALKALSQAVSSPSFQAAMSKRFKPKPPFTPRIKPVYHTESFACEGKKGDIIKTKRISTVVFRGEKIIMLDTSNTEGRGTRVKSFRVAGEEQLPPQSEIWTSDFPANSLSCGISFKIAHPKDLIEIDVEFVEDCKWNAHIVGRAVGGTP